MSLLTLKSRVVKLELIRAQKDQHAVIVFFGTPDADGNAERLVAEGRAEAERLGKELNVIKIGWQSDLTD